MNQRSKTTLLLFLSCLAFSSTAPVLSAARVVVTRAKQFLKVDEALALAFPGAEVKRGTVYLTEEQKKKAAKLAKTKLTQSIVHPYEAFDKKGELVGTAYFDTHQVRTKKESIMIIVAPDGTIARIELCAFGEPLDYMPSGRWYGQFLGKRLDDDLNLGRDIQGITGATLSGQATTRCARRVLATHLAIQPPAPKPKPIPKPGPKPGSQEKA